MTHSHKPDFVFPRNGRVHSNRWGRQFSRLLAAEVCASALVMLDIPHSEVAWEYWLPTPFASFPFTSPPVRHRVPPGSERALPTLCNVLGWWVSRRDRVWSYLDSRKYLRQVAIITKQSRGIYVSAGTAASSFDDRIKEALASFIVIHGILIGTYKWYIRTK